MEVTMSALKRHYLMETALLCCFLGPSCNSSFQGPNQPPIAIAGSDQEVTQGEQVRLNGSRSYDPEGDDLEYIWSFVSLPNGSNTNFWTENEKATFQADLEGEYLIGLIVRDNKQAKSQMDVVMVRTTGRKCSSNLDCDDGEDCTLDLCIDGHCVHQDLVDDSSCDDGLFCTINDTCLGGHCEGTKRSCGDFTDICNRPICNDHADQCQKIPIADDTVCDDGLFCTVNESCQAGECTNGQPRDCSANGHSCVDGVCDEIGDRCVGDPLPANTPCDDQQFCTITDSCDGAGNCVGEQRSCDHLDGACTKGYCDEHSTTCIASPANEAEACDDGSACSDPDFCQNGICTGALMDEDFDGVCDPNDLCNGDNNSGDTDADGTCNNIDTDDDNDRWFDEIELSCNTDPQSVESFPTDGDGDGVCDFLDDCEGDDARGDSDNDSLCNDIDLDDDGDNWPDVDEIACGSDPLVSTSLPEDDDADFICDSLDLCYGDNGTGDTDADKQCNDSDLDDDGDDWFDSDEINCNTDPLLAESFPSDSDDDGICDILDPCTGVNTSGDTDGDGLCNDTDLDDDSDGWSDSVEIACGTDPIRIDSVPQDDDTDGVCNGLDQCIGDDASGDYDGDNLCNDIDPPTWESRSNIAYAAGEAASAWLNDGLHYLGGANTWDTNDCYQHHYLYDALSDTWSSYPADIPDTDTCASQAQVFENCLFLVGGWPDGRRFRVYHPMQNSWQELDDIPERFERGFVTAIVGQYLFVIGGEPGSKDNAPVYKYDLIEQTWSPCADIPKNHGHGSLAGTAVGEKIYVLNGDKAGDGTILQIYDTLTDSWSTGQDLSQHFDGAAAVAIQNKAYFFGGALDHDADVPIDITNEVKIYDPGKDTWLSGPEMPTARYFSTAQYIDGWIHVLGGYNENGFAMAIHEVIAR